jgi:hypothetical protein
MTRPEHNFVMVEWHDTHADQDGWFHISDIDHAPCLVLTAGFHLPTTEGGKEGHVTIYQTRIFGEDQIDSAVHIPVQMVVNMRIIVAGDIADL